MELMRLAEAYDLKELVAQVESDSPLCSVDGTGLSENVGKCPMTWEIGHHQK